MREHFGEDMPLQPSLPSSTNLGSGEIGAELEDSNDNLSQSAPLNAGVKVVRPR